MLQGLRSAGGGWGDGQGQIYRVQARRLNEFVPSPSKHSPHPPVPRTPNNTVPTLQKCPLIQEKSLSPLETARITQFCAVCASKCPTQKWVVWRSGSTSRSDQISLQNPHGESAICKISACGEPEERECGAPPSAASQPLADVSRAGKTGVDRAKKVSPR